MIEKYIIKIAPRILLFVGVMVFATASSFEWPERGSSIPLITSVRSHAQDLIFISAAFMVLGYYMHFQNRRITALKAAIEELQKEKGSSIRS